MHHAGASHDDRRKSFHDPGQRQGSAAAQTPPQGPDRRLPAFAVPARGQQVEEDLRARGLAQVKSDEVGRAILKPLRDLDEVAYMRFASVYQNFENLEDFQNAIDELKADALK